METLRIATRRSPLAWRQAELVRDRLTALHAGLQVELVGLQSQGDRVLDRPLAAIGGKGLFVKELERGLLDGRADIAVHSMKDVPEDCEPGLHLPVMVARESPYDAFVSGAYSHPSELPAGAVIGTCSLRRASQLRHRYPGCRIADLRGNVNTRLGKLDAGAFDAIVLAVAGLERLGLEGRITARLEAEVCLPGIGQGALGIECRIGDRETEDLIRSLNDPTTVACVRAERAISHGLGGSCLSPIAGFAREDAGQLTLEGRVGASDGGQLLSATVSGPAGDPEAVGHSAAADLAQQGAREILAAEDAAG